MGRAGHHRLPGARRGPALPGRGVAAERGALGGAVEAAFREESGRAVAVLTRVLGDLDLAEEAVQEAFVAALGTWAERGVPPSAAGWIITTARNRALDRLRREASRDARQRQAALLALPDQPEEVGPVRDDQLRLIFTCAHPALSVPAQVALTLRLIGGLQTPEIARAFLVPEATMAQRIVRAKNKIRQAHIPYRVPQQSELPGRLRTVLAVVYLVHNEGYVTSAGPGLGRVELGLESIRLGRLLHELMPDEPEVAGLLSLLLLTESRRPARTDREGALVRLADQDRSLWDGALITEGQALLRECLRRGQPGRYQLQAAIAAVHADAASAEETDWAQIVTCYDQLYALSPTPVVALNRAIAVAEVSGPAAGLALLDELELDRYHLVHAARADLLARLGQPTEAATAYRAAIELTDNAAERDLLLRRLGQLDGTP